MSEPDKKHLEAIKFVRDKNELTILDQVAIPETRRYIRINHAQDGYNAIAKMFVRGAPAIGVVAVLSVAVEMKSTKFTDKSEIRGFVATQGRQMCKARPTANSLARRVEWLTKVVNECSEMSDNLEEIKEAVMNECEGLFLQEYELNLTLSDHGVRHLLSACQVRLGVRLTTLTHCNTGSLATVGYGTALGVIRKLHEQGKLECCYYTETRPYFQGSRLTAYEVREDKIPACLVADSGVCHLLQTKTIHCVIVGADRIAANGDTANKIGTHQIAVVAKHHGVPFYVAAPVDTVDLKVKSGRDISVEERDASEMLMFRDKKICPDGTKCWNPAFDITPCDLIAGIITEKGVFKPDVLAKEVAPYLKRT